MTTLNDVLNTDVNVVGARLRDAFNWWIEELRAVCAPLTAQTSRRPGVFADPQPGGGFKIRRPGLSPQRLVAGSRVAAAVVLPAASVLIRALPKPALPERDIRRMIALDLERLTPFPADAVYYDVAVAPAAVEGDKETLRLAVVRRSEADLLLADARASGIDAAALVIGGEEAAFDFFPAMRSAGSVGEAGSRSGYLWAVVGVLVALNVGVAVWRDIRDLDALNATVAAQAPVVEQIQQLRNELQNQSATARAAQRANGEPLRVLSAASEALPETAWVQRFSWDGASVRLAGSRQEGVDVVAALRRATGFGDVREADVASSAPGSFDVVADVAPVVRAPGRR